MYSVVELLKISIDLENFVYNFLTSYYENKMVSEKSVYKLRAIENDKLSILKWKLVVLGTENGKVLRDQKKATWFWSLDIERKTKCKTRSLVHLSKTIINGVCCTALVLAFGPQFECQTNHLLKGMMKVSFENLNVDFSLIFQV